MLPVILAPARSAFFHDRNAYSGCEFANSGRKIDVFIIHHETEDRAPHTAPETMKCLALRTNVKRWCFLLVKRAERLEVRSRTFDRKIGSDHLHDIIGGGDLFDCLRRNGSH